MKHRHDARLIWLLWPLAACAVLVSTQAWTDAGGPQQNVAPEALSKTADARLKPTSHPPVPARLETMWYVPESSGTPSAALSGLAKGVQILEDSGNASEALPLVSQAALTKTPVADYARYYTGVALQRLNRLDEADAAFESVAALDVPTQLPESALYRRAEIREVQQDFPAAVAMYELVLKRKPSAPQVALVKLGAAAAAAGDRVRAIEAHRRVLREFSLSPEAAEAERLLGELDGFVLDSPAMVAEELGRAEALFKARRYDRAREAFGRVRGRLHGDDEHHAIVRLAQLEAARGLHRTARETLQRYVGHSVWGVEAQFGVLSATRAMGDHHQANSLTEDFVARHPAHPLAEEALNEMARQYVLDDDDGKAAEIYTRMVDRFPAGAFAERGAWKAGWWAYRVGNFTETVRVFERGAATFSRSDYRPSWLYWVARSYERMDQRDAAVERYRLVATDYLNSYYGRLAWARLEKLKSATLSPGVRRAVVSAPPPLPNIEIIQALIAAGLNRPALNELQHARRVAGDSPPLQATIALVHHRLGDLRLGITAMRRAYPQFMAAGGEDLPVEILRVIFPLDYWPLLKGNAQAHGLDPYVVAALAAQESTFDARIRSSANAVGLMQIIPPTGRRLARRVGMRGFTERSLENPEINARLGTRYFADMYKEFGGYHFALAGYNAGEHRVRQWNDEAPGLAQDEWIDNIPYPETQNYVKRILGTAEDYRRLYGSDAAATSTSPAKKATKAPAAKSQKPAPQKPPGKKPPKKSR